MNARLQQQISQWKQTKPRVWSFKMENPVECLMYNKLDKAPVQH